MDLASADKKYLWHPFTPMAAWCSDDNDPLVLTRGEGVYLFDDKGNRYIDGNSSIWTNIHGHNHPRISDAIKKQLDEVAHTSFLGATNPNAILLAKKLVELAPDGLDRVFYSDDGSTAVEVALRMAVQFFEQKGHPERKRLIAFEKAYHGDTLGAASSGGIPIFRGSTGDYGYPVSRVGSLEDLERLPAEDIVNSAALIIEPLVQGAAGIRPWPEGMLKSLERWCRRHDVLLILDEVLTGFGRTGAMFACEREEVVPDFLCLAKGLTGGYLPLAATITSERIFEEFLNGDDGVDRTFYYGHSYCGNSLGCAAAIASLEVFAEENVLSELAQKVEWMTELLTELAREENVRETRQCGFLGAVELGRKDGTPFSPQDRVGAKVCKTALKYGLLTRPILDSIVIIPPLSIKKVEMVDLGNALRNAIRVCSQTMMHTEK